MTLLDIGCGWGSAMPEPSSARRQRHRTDAQARRPVRAGPGRTAFDEMDTNRSRESCCAVGRSSTEAGRPDRSHPEGVPGTSPERWAFFQNVSTDHAAGRRPDVVADHRRLSPLEFALAEMGIPTHRVSSSSFHRRDLPGGAVPCDDDVSEFAGRAGFSIGRCPDAALRPHPEQSGRSGWRPRENRRVHLRRGVSTASCATWWAARTSSSAGCQGRAVHAGEAALVGRMVAPEPARIVGRHSGNIRPSRGYHNVGVRRCRQRRVLHAPARWGLDSQNGAGSKAHTVSDGDRCLPTGDPVAMIADLR